MGRRKLQALLAGLPVKTHKNLLVGFENADDAGVYQINKNQAIIQTVDFFAPIVDDPFVFGQIAAANALSDVYAMGGTPLTAMNVVSYPIDLVKMGVMRNILLGSMSKLKEAKTVLLGGHTVESKELKFGLSVTGIAHPSRVIRNNGVNPGDVFILTKPLGTGIITTALKQDGIPLTQAREAIESMRKLNAKSAAIMKRFAATAATDITGFGLIGHALEMAKASGLTITFDSERIPVMSAALKLSQTAGFLTKANRTNRENISRYVVFAKKIGEPIKRLLFDPQTSGGLLFSLPTNNAQRALASLLRSGHKAAIVAEAYKGKPRVKIH